MYSKFYKNQKKKIIATVLIVLLILIINIIMTLLIGTLINIGQGKIDIANIIPNWMVAMPGENLRSAENVATINSTNSRHDQLNGGACVRCGKKLADYICTQESIDRKTRRGTVVITPYARNRIQHK